jgi:glycosyltransferase involved in cell wall biosynthesis
MKATNDSEGGVAAMNSTRILLATYHFPPSAAVGGLRMARFARLLPEFGWDPYVITVRDEDRERDEGTDLTRLIGLETTPIKRTHAPSGIIDLYGRVKGRLRPRVASGGHVASTSGHSSTGRESSETMVRRLKRYVVSLFVRLPDEQKNWSLLAVPAAIRMIREHRIEWILTSGPPFSVHLIGLMAALLTDVRWVADFRDPWIELLPERVGGSRSWLSDRIEEWMEATVLRRADRVLTTTERIRSSMMARHPALPGDRFAYLPNGIDAQRLVPLDWPEKYEPLTITYAGTLYFDRTPEPLFRAFGELIQEGKVKPTAFRIKLVGNCHHIAGIETMELASHYGVESAIEVIDRVPQVEAIRIMQRSHLLLVLAPSNHDLVLPAKIFDYLGSGSKILAIAGAGATADLIRETDAGCCFSPDDVAGLKKYFHELLEGQRYENLRNEPGLFARYDARSLTGQLVAELSNTLPHPSHVQFGA